jgi:hypothetical protein
MKFALVNNNRIEATKGARGVCPHCNSKVIAKCGKLKVNHWAHKRSRNCDSWWEPETDWHRLWKGRFPVGWQEVSFEDEKTGEKHIADVFTEHDLVIEFQHSHIKAEEQMSRENFYKNMVWVVDGTRLKSDFPRFEKANRRKTNRRHIFGVWLENNCFPHAWLDRKTPVIFDFLGTDKLGAKNDLRKNLYCLFPQTLGEHRIFAEITRTAFIKSIIDGYWSSGINKMKAEINKGNQAINKMEEHQDEHDRKALKKSKVKRSTQRSTTRRRRRRF